MMRTINQSIAIIIMVIFSSCHTNEPKEKKMGQAPVVEGIITTPTQLNIAIKSTGELTSNEATELKAPIAGIVTGIFFEEGQFIKKGQLLVEIDHRQYDSRLKAVNASLQLAAKNLARRKKLESVEGISREEIDKAEMEAATLEAEKQELEVNIDLCMIRAPFDGKVGMRSFSTGSFLSIGQKITDLEMINPLKLTFDIPGKYGAYAQVGQEIEFENSNGVKEKAKVYAINPSINPESKSINIKALVEKANEHLIPGDFVNVVFNLQTSDSALMLPTDAIIPALNSQSVYVFKSGKAVGTEVTTGVYTSDKVQIISGLNVGDTIIVTGLMRMFTGQEVKIKIKE